VDLLLKKEARWGFETPLLLYLPKNRVSGFIPLFQNVPLARVAWF